VALTTVSTSSYWTTRSWWVQFSKMATNQSHKCTSYCHFCE